MSNLKLSGVGAAILAAALFGASTPFSKVLLGEVSPILLAGLLYLGSGTGLSVLFVARRLRRNGAAEMPLVRKDWPWLAGAIVSGAIVGALLLMSGLQRTPASTSSLLLNMEGVFTAALAWLVFRENADRRVVLGMVFILLGGLALSWQGNAESVPLLGTALILAACLCWGIDNNLTQKVSASDPFQVAAIKGLVAGVFNTALAFALGAKLPALGVTLAALLIGFVSYGLSIVLFVLALRNIGTARTGAYFAVAPFVGAVLSIFILREPVSYLLLLAGLLMGIGVWQHLTERHGHGHQHTEFEHAHPHTHDEHHQHQHELGIDANQLHTHAHVHNPQMHVHPHYPDIHHRHVHSPIMPPTLTTE